MSVSRHSHIIYFGFSLPCALCSTLLYSWSATPRNLHLEAMTSDRTSLDADIDSPAPVQAQAPETEKLSQPQASPAPPDGGLVAWIQCAAGFCIFMNTFGLLNTFGNLEALRLLRQHGRKTLFN